MSKGTSSNSGGHGPGLDDPANHDQGDDNGGGGGHVPGADDPANHDQGDDHGGGQGPGNGGVQGGANPGNSGPPVVTAETLTGTDMNDRLKGGDGDDTISGLGGNDRLEGDKGADTIDGGAGDDTITGGQGADVLTGGDGADVFKINGPAHLVTDVDKITDFTHGVDHLRFDESPAATAANFATDTAADFKTAMADANAKIAAGADFVAVQVGADVVVFADEIGEHHADSAVLLVGKTLADISFSDIG
jgi:Ca2+-binding RTX toxin-like protein